MNIAIYARVSTDLQAEQGYSIQTQIESCEAKARDLVAVTVKRYIDDGYSGAYLERPALEALRDAIHAKLFDAVVCYTPDRLARRLSHQLLLTEEIEKSGASLIFVNSEYKDTPEGRLFYQMQGAFAEYEREKIRERTMRGRRGKLRSGRPITDSHVYGYDFDQEHGYTVNEAEAAIIREVYRLYVEGNVGGIDMIAAKLTADGVPTPSGKHYWHGASVLRILTQPMYIGRYYSNRYATRKTGPHSKQHFTRPESEWIEMRCPAIIDESTFADAQYYLKRNRCMKKHTRANTVYLLQGLMRCAKCGKAIGIRNNNGYRYYSCYLPRHGGNPRQPCDARYARTEIVDAAFWNLLQAICSTPAALAAYIRQNEGKQAIARKPSSPDKKTRLEAIAAERAAIMDWFERNYITQADATKKLAKLKSEEDHLHHELESSIGKTDSPPKTPDHLQEIVHSVTTCAPDAQSRRKVILAIISGVEYQRTDTRTGSNPDYDLSFTIHFR